MSTSKPEQSFSIQPHPAKTNDPADLQPQEQGKYSAAINVLNTPGPVIPTQEMLKNLPPPLSSEELRTKQAALAEQAASEKQAASGKQTASEK